MSTTAQSLVKTGREPHDKRDTLRRLIREFRRFRRPGSIALAGVVLGVVCQVLMPLVVAVAAP